MRQIAESDWKIFKKLHPIALERFYARAVLEIAEVMADQSRTPRERFWKVSEITEEHGKDVSEIFDDYRRSTALFQLAIIRRRGFLTDEEIATFGPDARAFVQGLMEFGKS